MSTKKNYIKQNTNARLRRMNRMLQALIYIMAGVVLYDSYVHNTPLYYILFYFAGLVVGRVYKRLMVVQHEVESQEFSLKVSKWDIVFTIALVLLRLVYGLGFLESMHIVWASDALYLFFIGIYRAKWKGIVNQIDEIVYELYTNRLSISKIKK